MAWLWEPDFSPEFSSLLHLNTMWKIRYTHLSSARCMRMWPNFWANFRWAEADLRHPGCLMGLKRSPADCSALCGIPASPQLLPGFLCDPQGNTSLFCPCAEGCSAGPPGEIAEVFHGMVDPALAIPETFLGFQRRGPSCCSGGAQLGRGAESGELCCQVKSLVWRKEKTYPMGCCLPGFPALHKAMASHPSDPISPGTHTTLLSHWVLQWCLNNLNAWKTKNPEHPKCCHERINHRNTNPSPLNHPI